MAGVVIDRHLLAWLSIAAVLLDVLGGLYLAYDLLGGERGPLRTLTRAVTYGTCFGVVYGISFGPAFGLVAGVGLGLLLGLEFARMRTGAAAKAGGVRWSVLLFGVLRGAVLGLAAGLTFGAPFGVAFGLLAALGIVVAYLLRFSPVANYDTAARPRWRWRAVQAAAARGVAIGLAAIVAGLLTHGSVGVALEIKLGVVVGVVGTVVSTLSPFVEWWADHLPPRRLGAVGVGLLLCGLALSSVQYWTTIFNIPVR